MSTDPNRFSWNDFLVVAERLAQADDEANLRTSVGRAYYAGFHSAREFVEERGLESQGTSHERVWRVFAPPFERKPREYRRVWNFGTRLRQARNSADYELSPLNWEEQSKKCLADSKELLSLVLAMRSKGSP